jgi:phospholipid-translocating ATPase
MGKELYDDILRWNRDKELNNQVYTRITEKGAIRIPSADLKVGHIIEVMAGERVPADMVLLSTSETEGSIFIKTDQLDGETDWKLRKAVAITHKASQEQGPSSLLELSAMVVAEPPNQLVDQFTGRFHCRTSNGDHNEGLGVENTLWASTVVTTGSCIGIVIYTGKETKSMMNSTTPSNKIGITDHELNILALLLLILMLGVSLILLALSGFTPNSHVQMFRYVLLLSTIIPISLRVNLDMAKIYYCYKISNDPHIPNTKPRNSTIPEELGRIHFLLTDKTGTLTKNLMTLKKIEFEFAGFTKDNENSISTLREGLLLGLKFPTASSYGQQIRSREAQIRDCLTAMALCHKVTTVYDNEGHKAFQASSPDEIALVEFAQDMGVELKVGKEDHMELETSYGREYYTILNIFPFSSARKRMGILLRDEKTGNIIFYMKGAEEVVVQRVHQKTRAKLLEDCSNLAREGLRTMVLAQRMVSESDYRAFDEAYERARSSMVGRDAKVAEVIETLERDMEYLAVTGVEDKLQEDAGKTIENLRHANIAVWVLTGDKVETAKCIAKSTRLLVPGRELGDERCVHLIDLDYNELQVELTDLQTKDIKGKVLVIDGKTLNLALSSFEKMFIEVAMKADSVLCCRVSPTQKTRVVEALKKHTKYRICSIGDGGNDVGMIQAAHVGVGVEGVEGKQASLAADFSVSEFRSLNKLVLWHGRLSYKRTAKLSNFIFHRGLIIAVIQALFISVFYYCAIPIYNGLLMLGYSSIYTMMPVFSLVLEEDTDVATVMTYPQLYKTLRESRFLGLTTFLMWMWKSLYQGSVIILLALVLFPETNFLSIVAITFTSLILTELLNVWTEIERSHWLMYVAWGFSLLIYVLSMLLMNTYFDLEYIFSMDFLWRVLLITTCSWAPLHIGKFIKDRLYPPEHRKVMLGELD